MPPLRRRLTDDMQIRNLSPSTQGSCTSYVKRFARHFGQSPERLGPEQVRDYQVILAKGKQLSPSTINVATVALRFLYGDTLGKDRNFPEVLPAPERPSKLPVVPSPEEGVRSLDGVAKLGWPTVPWTGGGAVTIRGEAAGLPLIDFTIISPLQLIPSLQFHPHDLCWIQCLFFVGCKPFVIRGGGKDSPSVAGSGLGSGDAGQLEATGMDPGQGEAVANAIHYSRDPGITPAKLNSVAVGIVVGNVLVTVGLTRFL